MKQHQQDSKLIIKSNFHNWINLKFSVAETQTLLYGVAWGLGKTQQLRNDESPLELLYEFFILFFFMFFLSSFPFVEYFPDNFRFISVNFLFYFCVVNEIYSNYNSSCFFHPILPSLRVFEFETKAIEEYIFVKSNLIWCFGKFLNSSKSERERETFLLAFLCFSRRRRRLIRRVKKREKRFWKSKSSSWPSFE